MQNKTIKQLLSELLILEEDFTHGRFYNIDKKDNALEETFSLVRELNDRVNKVIRDLT